MKVLIWSIEHKAWWRENSRGYTSDQEDAGLYDLEVAEGIVENANSYSLTTQEVIVFPFGEDFNNTAWLAQREAAIKRDEWRDVAGAFVSALGDAENFFPSSAIHKALARCAKLNGAEE